MDEKFMQIDNINYIINRLGKELWIQVYGHQDMNGADALFWAGLIPNEHMAKVLKNTNWEHEIGCHSPGFVGYGSGDYVYDKYSGFEYEPLLFLRDYHGIKESNIEISEEFRLLNNLYYDHKENKYLNISDTGELEPVIKIEKENVYIKLSYLKRFAAVKQMGVALYFDIRFDSKNSLEEMGLNSKYGNHFGSDCCFDFNYNNYDSIMSQNRSYSIIHGKKILFGVSMEECGYWPYDNKKDYEDFVVGIDDNGQEVKFTSDPDKLGNFFGMNPDAPHYLTPVYFSKDVLNKYYSKPELYEVNDGHIRCQGLWLLRIDNLNKEYVSVYLGDLGRDIPQKEQVYWKSYNIIPDGKLSDVKFKRDFLAEFADPEIADMKFKLAFTRFRKKWAEKFGWDLFLELTEADRYNFEHLRIPISKFTS